MDLGWQRDNPAITLEKYCVDSGTFAEKKKKNEEYREELSLKQSKFDSYSIELSGLQGRLSSMGSYEQGDLAGTVQDVKNSAQKRTDDEKRKFEERKSELSHKRDEDIRENDNLLKERLTQLLGNDADADRELTETEKKALEFEIQRRQFIAASNDRINEFEDAITQERLACQTEIGELKSRQDDVNSEFEPDVEKFKGIIDSINYKFQPGIRACQNAVSEQISRRDGEVGQLQEEKNKEIQFTNNEIDGYQKEFKKTERKYNEQIRIAKLKNAPTTRLESSKISRLNAINDQIQKANNRVNRKVFDIDQKIETVQNRYAKLIEKAESQLESVISDRTQELSEPTKIYNDLIQERDRQTAALQYKIDQRENECHSKESQYNNDIELERRAQSNNNNRIDQQIVEYAMSGDTCFATVLDEQNAPYVALQGRIDTWMAQLSCIKKGKLSPIYEKEHEKQKGILVSKEYDELQSELSEATQYNDQLSVFAKYNGIFTIAGGILAALGIISFVVLVFALNMSVVTEMAGIATAVIGIALAAFTIFKTRKEFSKICRYISLASDYHEFPCIAAHSTQITRDKELAMMKEMGDKLYAVHYGRTEAQNLHDAKDADIKSDYENDLKLIKKEFENVIAQIERDRNAEIKSINEKAAKDRANFNKEKEELQIQIDSLTSKVKGLDSEIRNLKKEIEENTQFMEAFENAYSIFDEKLNDETWIAPMSFTKGKLNNSLYIVPDNDERDNCNHRKIYRVDHNKKAFVVNYDITSTEEKVEEVNKIIHDLMFDLMYAVYRINSKETYMQFIVDGNAATNDLMSTNVKNAFNIGEVVGRIEDIRARIKSFSMQKDKLAAMGKTIDELNESKFNSQDRPLTYNILYIIFKPDEKRNKLDDELRMLSTGCEKYGFLPVFICERNTWKRESQEKDSIYKDIKNLANGEVLIFDGKKYTSGY